jgi:hypothetical protein
MTIIGNHLLAVKILDSWEIVQQKCILDFDLEQFYLVEYLLILKINRDMGDDAT